MPEESSEALSRPLEWGEYLATLAPPERHRARQAARQALLANLPDEEVGAAPVRTLGAFLDDPIETPPMLVHPGLVAMGGITALTSKGGKGKTAFSFNRLLRWAMGKPMFDELPEVMRPERALRSLIIENEGAGWHTQKVLRTILDSNGFAAADLTAARENVHVWGDGGWSGMKLDDAENLALVRRGVEVTRPDIVFLEPFRGLWTGEENSSGEMAKVMDAFHGIANDFGCAIVITHHDRKMGRGEGGDPLDAARGSGVFGDLGAVVETWAPVGGGQREWSLSKWRWDEPPAPIRMRWERHRWGYALVEEDANVRRAVQELMAYRGSELDLQTIAAGLDEKSDRVRKWLEQAIAAGLVKKRPLAGHMMYRVPAEDAADNEADDDGLPLT